MRRLATTLAAAAISVAFAASADASVIYTFSGTASFNGEQETFVYEAPTFITADTTVAPGAMTSCTNTADACVAVQFFVDAIAANLTSTPSTAILWGEASLGSYSYFVPGAFGTPGSYNSMFDFNPATLTVTDTNAETPEPSVLALVSMALLSLFGLSMTRRRAGT